MLRRLPIESAQPLVLFALSRLAMVCLGLLALVLVSFPHEGWALTVVAAVALPWSVAVLVLALRNPEFALSPFVVGGDFVVLLVAELVLPESYAAVRFAALFIIAAHAHFQGEPRALAVVLIGAGLLVGGTLLRGDQVVSGAVLALYEIVFAVAAIATALVLGRLRTAESASRMRARSLSRRAIQAESDVRRKVAESIHDGPVQELIGLDMMLTAARNATEQGRHVKAVELLDEARLLAERNIRGLRDEIVDLGPYAFEELSFPMAVDNCMPVWERRYGFRVELELEELPLPSDVAGGLFRIVQEAVANAGRHADAETVTISLRAEGPNVELTVRDDGNGFRRADPLAPSEPGHLGLATMRERAELLDGALEIDTSDEGTTVSVRAPLPAAKV
jgi:signal transduction histidine kinase